MNGLCAIVAGSLLCFSVFCESKTTDSIDTKNVREIINADIAPEVNWNHYSADCARSISAWMRWWKYLRAKAPFVVDLSYGMRMGIYPRNEECRAIYVRGIYDPNQLVAIKTLLPKGGIFIDVGANMGYFSVFAAKIVGDKGRVIAIEPSSREFDRLEHNLKLNRLKNASAHRLAITDKVGKTKISIATDERSSLNTIGYEFSVKGVEKIKTEEVESTTFDNFLKTARIKKIDLIKLDVEGSEIRALKGAERSIKKYRPIIILGTNKDALNVCDGNLAQLDELIKKLHYVAYYIAKNDNGFEFRKLDNLSNVLTKTVVCVYENTALPKLPEFSSKSFVDELLNFFNN